MAHTPAGTSFHSSVCANDMQPAVPVNRALSFMSMDKAKLSVAPCSSCPVPLRPPPHGLHGNPVLSLYRKVPVTQQLAKRLRTV